MAETYKDPGHWFWRGVQSAIFYYISCAPCIDYQYKKKRRKEAKAATQLVDTEPGIIRQPTAFQTNEQWAEELILGPGPPKPWKPDELLQKVKQKFSAPEDAPKDPQPSARPSIDRRVSNTFGTVKESLRQSLHPDKWNWKRYDREDEQLWGLGDKMTKIWDRMAGTHEEVITGRKRAYTNESDQQDYMRGRNAAVNDLHPAVVSQLPATREEAAWMLLPPPSAAVMNGKQRPGEDTSNRRPLCVMGRPLPRAETEHRHDPPDKEPDWASDVETPDVPQRPNHDRHLSEPLPNWRLPADDRHMSEPAPLLKRPSPALLPDSFDSKSDIIPREGTVTPKSRPSSWQFYIIPNDL